MTLEQSWYSRFGWSWLLLPLSAVFALLSALRRTLYRLGLKSSHHPGVPVIVVGNITVGGTGKTPFTLWLCQQLQAQGLKPGILSRGYGAKLAAPTLVLPAHHAADVGDEPKLLALQSGCPVMVWPKRVEGAKALLAQADVNILICDDGLQHYALQRDLEIVLIDGQRGVGNGWLLPAGPLREACSRLQQADVVLSNSGASALTPYQLHLTAHAAVPLKNTQTALASSACISLVSGIGNPQRFENTAITAGYSIKARHFFADHHAFCADDFTSITGPVLMTAKDAVKCSGFANDDWFYLPVTATPDAAAVALIDKKIAELRSSYGI